MSKNKDQHYLSAFYIYHFTNDVQRAKSAGKANRTTMVHHFDFSKSQLKERPIEKIATESYLLSYQNESGNYDHSLDERLRKVEENASAAFQELNCLYESISRKRPGAIRMPDKIINSVIDFLVWQVAIHPDLIREFEKECKTYIEESNAHSHDSKRMALDVVKNIVDGGALNIRDEFDRKNKTIICTSSEFAHFITSDKPFVRFNKYRNNGIGVKDTEMYYPLTSNMLLFMCGDGDDKRIILNNDRETLRQLNTYMAKNATRYIIGKSDVYLNRIYKNIAQK